MPICNHCSQDLENNQAYSAHINNYCRVIKRNNHLREQQRQKEREEEIRLEEKRKQLEDEKKSLEILKRITLEHENEIQQLQLTFANQIIHEKEKNEKTVANRLDNIEKLLVVGNEKLDSQSEKLDEISQQQKQMLQTIENIFQESYIYFIEQMKAYIEHCKKYDLLCYLTDFENCVREDTTYKHTYILDCIKTKQSLLQIADLDKTNIQNPETQLVWSTKLIWKPKLDEHLNTILELIDNHFIEAPKLQIEQAK